MFSGGDLLKNQQNIPIIKEVNALEINPEIKIQTTQLNEYWLKIVWFFTLAMGYLSFDTLFEEIGLLSSINRYIPYAFVYLVSMGLGIALIKVLERAFEIPIKKIKANDAITGWLSAFAFVYFVFVIGSPQFFFENVIPDQSLAAYYSAIMYFSFGLITYLALHGSQFANSFESLKTALENLLKYMEGDNFIFKVDEIESDLLEALDYFNDMLKRNRLGLKLGFVIDYLYMLKWFGTKEERTDFTLTLFNILKEYNSLNITKIESLFATLEEQFNNLKESRRLVEKRVPLSKKLWLSAKDHSKELLVAGVTIAGYILTFMGLI